MMTRQYILPYSELRKLHNHAYLAQQSDHSEICGVIVLSNDDRIELLFLNNISTKSYHYELEIELVNKLEQDIESDGKKILGTFHSHPISEAIPSKGDLENGFYNGVEMIYDVCGREIKLWCLSNKTEMILNELQLVKEPRSKGKVRKRT
jgi:proteasome lid subunit RPN8/RPN11